VSETRPVSRKGLREEAAVLPDGAFSGTSVHSVPNHPVRIQRQRTKGWRMPPNTLYVGRPTWFGNPFTPEKIWGAGYSGDIGVAIKACVRAYREWLTSGELSLDWRYPAFFIGWLESAREGRLSRLGELRGKNLACWCPLGQPCHADVLLEIANKP
jgi:hypothetical protein